MRCPSQNLNLRPLILNAVLYTKPHLYPNDQMQVTGKWNLIHGCMDDLFYRAAGPQIPPP